MTTAVLSAKPSKLIGQITSPDGKVQVLSYETPQDAVFAAQSTGEMSTMLPVIVYQQGERFFMTAVVSLEMLLEMSKPPRSLTAKDADADLLSSKTFINRKVSADHIKGIEQYLQTNSNWVMPNVTMCVEDKEIDSEPLIRVYSYFTSRSYIQGYIAWNRGTIFTIVDGQHRREAIQRIARQEPSWVEQYSVTISLYVGTSADARKDFAAMAKARPIDKSMAVAYGGDLLNEITMSLIANSVLNRRVRMEGTTVSHTDGMNLFTANQVSNAVKTMLFGNSTKSTVNKGLQRIYGENSAEELTEVSEVLTNDLIEFFALLGANLPEWPRLRIYNDTPLNARRSIPKEMRQNNLHFIGAGFSLLYELGHEYLRNETWIGYRNKAGVAAALRSISWSLSDDGSPWREFCEPSYPRNGTVVYKVVQHRERLKNMYVKLRAMVDAELNN